MREENARGADADGNRGDHVVGLRVDRGQRVRRDRDEPGRCSIPRHREDRDGHGCRQHEGAPDPEQGHAPAGHRPRQRRPCARSRARRRNALRRRQRRIVAEHRLLEALQSLARLETQFLGEQAARLVVDTQRVRLSAGAIEREHQLPAKAFAQWMLRNQSLQLRSDVGVAAESQIRLEPLLDCAEAQLVQPADLALSERVVGEVGEGRPAPEGERFSERRGRVLGVAGGQLSPSLLDEAPEPVDVQLVRPHLEHVTAGMRTQDPGTRLGRRIPRVGLERLPQTRDIDLDVLHGIRRRPFVPDGSISRSTETTSFRCRSSIARTIRCWRPPSSTSRPWSS